VSKEAIVPSKARGHIGVRVSDSERATLEAAAELVPDHLSTWIRDVALTAAREALEGKQ
jgi:uncharacterized protein (DUF1778 family)